MELKDIVTAWLNGETVQYRSINDNWDDLLPYNGSGVVFYNHRAYRIKPKEQWLLVFKFKGSEEKHPGLVIYASKDKAERAAAEAMKRAPSFESFRVMKLVEE